MKLLFVLATLLCCFISVKFVAKAVYKLGEIKAVSRYRTTYIVKTLTLAVITLYVLIMLALVGIEYSQVVFFISSLFAVIGVALFAQWSILSNLTASLIIFFAFPYRVGDVIKVVDKDENIAGEVQEITLFHVLIKRDNGDTVIYPNNLILQKAVIKHDRSDKVVASDGATSKKANDILIDTNTDLAE